MHKLLSEKKLCLPSFTMTIINRPIVVERRLFNEL